MLVGRLETKEIPLKTKYGLLSVPTKDVLSIRVGVHYHKDYLDKLNREIKRLDSGVHKEREAAVDSLIKAKRHGYFLLKNAASPEVQSRFEVIKERIKDSERLEDDRSTISVFGSSFQGHLVEDFISLYVEDLGSVKIPIASVAQIARDNLKCSIKANEDWLDTGYLINRRHVGTATGEVDLWPATPKNWCCGYKGHNGPGRLIAFNAGALICKIGVNGEPFIFDTLGTQTKTQRGNLFLHIVGNAWNTQSVGGYTVELNGD